MNRENQSSPGSTGNVSASAVVPASIPLEENAGYAFYWLRHRFKQSNPAARFRCSSQENKTCFLHLSPSSLATNECDCVFLASVIHPVIFNLGFEKCTLPAWRLRGDPFNVSNEAKNGHAAPRCFATPFGPCHPLRSPQRVLRPFQA